MRFSSSAIVSIAAAILGATMCSASARADSPAATSCETLGGIDFSTIQDAPTEVNEAKVIDAAGEMPAYCHVKGYIAPQIGFELKLPASSWNGKFMELTCGGFCGTTDASYQIGWCGDAVRRGYACIVQDGGHHSAGGSLMWAYNNLQGMLDYGIRAAYAAAAAGKAITQTYYGKPPTYSYLMGCSGGGRQALMEAQRFPWDFDGIIAMEPSNPICTGVTALWNTRAMTDEQGKALFTSADIDILHSAVLGKCDANDGLKDGIIEYPPGCKFDPEELLCAAGRKTQCLSPAQVAAARKVYGGPVTSAGRKLFRGGATLGSEKGSYFLAATTPRPAFTAVTAANDSGSVRYQGKVDYFRYLAFVPNPGPAWNSADLFDFDADYKRLGVMGFTVADNPDLRQFKAAGGKLIIVQGWTDSASPLPLNTVDYYESVERMMGGRASTQDFARLFMVPGRDHCMGGAGATAIDFLSYLEAWVERGRAPDMLIGAHLKSTDMGDHVRAPKKPGVAAFTRPIYPYPARARYVGTGDPNDYRSFERVEP